MTGNAPSKLAKALEERVKHRPPPELSSWLDGVQDAAEVVAKILLEEGEITKEQAIEIELAPYMD